MNRKDKTVTIYFNRKLFMTGMVYCIVCLGIVVWMIWTVTSGFSIWDRENLCFCITMISFELILLVIIPLKSSQHMVFMKDGIELRSILKKTEYHSYREYCYVHKACYIYYGLPMYYIVISNRRLRNGEEYNINSSPITPMFLKIRYNQKNYETLLQILPIHMANSLKFQFKDISPKRFNFLI